MNTTTLPAPMQRALWEIHRWRWIVRGKLKHARLAWRFFRHRLDKQDAGQIAYEMMDIECEWPLICVNLDEVMEEARLRWKDHPQLEDLAHNACHRVWSRWDTGTDSARAAAHDWAMDIIERDAQELGVDLQPADEE